MKTIARIFAVLFVLVSATLSISGCLSQESRVDEADKEQTYDADSTPSILLIEQSPEPPQLLEPPNYLRQIFPEPGATISLPTLIEESRKKTIDKPSVCFSPVIAHTLEVEDRFGTIAKWLTRLSVEINDEPIEPQVVLKGDTFGGDIHDQETGEYLYTVPAGSLFRVCFPKEWESGLQIVDVNIDRTSKETLSYSWFFYLEE